MQLRTNSKDDSMADARRNRYKVAVDAEDDRRRRDDMVEIRKNKREESLQKKRREGLQNLQPLTFTSKLQPNSKDDSSTDYKADARRNRYKVAVDAEDGRRRREDDMVEIRKNKREESLQKKRRQGLHNQQPFTFTSKFNDLPAMVAGVFSNDGSAQLEATTLFRKLLSVDRKPPIEEVIQSGVVPCFVEFLAREDFLQLQFEAAWALTHIASETSENTKVVIDHGAVPLFVTLLRSPSEDVREQAVWALGNIAGDSPVCRDLVLNHGALASLLAQFNQGIRISMLRDATWALSNFCRGNPPPAFELVKPALSALERLILSKDEEVLTDACWALSYLSDGTDDKIQEFFDAGVCGRLVQLLNHKSASVLIPVMRTVRNIVTGDGIKTQLMINHGVLPYLLSLLTQRHKKSVRKASCSTISSIIAGGNKQIKAVINAGLIAPLVDLLHNAEFDIKKEAAGAIANVIAGGDHEQVKYLVDQGCIKPLCGMLNCSDARIVIVCLNCLENILNVGEEEKRRGKTGYSNLYFRKMQVYDGFEKIEELANHNNSEIYKKAADILDAYEEYLKDGDEMPSGDGDQSGFNFGRKSSIWWLQF